MEYEFFRSAFGGVCRQRGGYGGVSVSFPPTFANPWEKRSVVFTVLALNT